MKSNATNFQFALTICNAYTINWQFMQANNSQQQNGRNFNPNKYFYKKSELT